MVASEAVAQRCSVKKAFLKISQNSKKNTCARVSFLMKFLTEVCNFIKKETLAQVFSCEFFEISKNTFFTEHLWATEHLFLKSTSGSCFSGFIVQISHIILVFPLLTLNKYCGWVYYVFYYVVY